MSAARSALAALWSVGVLCVSNSACAEDRELRYDLRIDLPVTGLAISWLLGSELAKADLAAMPCRWCDRRNDGTDSVNGFDSTVRDALRWHNTGSADALSSVGAYGLAPIVAFGGLALAGAHDEALSRWPVDALVVTEAVALATSVNQVVKFSFGRERPFVHVLPNADKLTTAQPSDNNTSFYSGHTSLAFSLAVAAGTVATMRGYRWAPYVWASGLLVAGTTGYLRIAGDRHYATDVLAAAAFGSAIGFAVPYLFHRPLGNDGPTVGVTPVPGGAIVLLSWAPSSPGAGAGECSDLK